MQSGAKQGCCGCRERRGSDPTPGTPHERLALGRQMFITFGFQNQRGLTSSASSYDQQDLTNQLATLGEPRGQEETESPSLKETAQQTAPVGATA